jgi:serine/threonine-protein kinase RsbW
MGQSPKTRLVIPSKLTAVPGVLQTIIDQAQTMGYGKDEVFAIRLALDEAVSNAIRHGNKNDSSKTVTIEYTIDDQAVHISVIDDGCGFCRDSLPDPTLEENLTSPNGRGVMLIESYMSDVSFNEKGNCICMTKCKGCKLPNKG